MWGVMRAEWLKATRSGPGRGVLSLILAAGLLAVGGAAWVTLDPGNPGALRQTDYRALGWPDSLLMGQQVVNALEVFVTTCFIAWLIGHEYGLDTWKNLLVRYDGRGRFLAAKFLVGTVLLAGIYLLGLIAILAEAAGAHALVAGPAAQAGLQDVPRSAAAAYQDLLLKGVPLLLDLVVTVGVATAATVITRSTIGGALVALLARFGLEAIPRLLPVLTPYTPTPNIDSLARNLVQPGSGAVSSAQSLLVLGIYVVGSLAVAVVVFQRRDIAG